MYSRHGPRHERHISREYLSTAVHVIAPGTTQPPTNTPREAPQAVDPPTAAGLRTPTDPNQSFRHLSLASLSNAGPDTPWEALYSSGRYSALNSVLLVCRLLLRGRLFFYVAGPLEFYSGYIRFRGF